MLAGRDRLARTEAVMVAATVEAVVTALVAACDLVERFHRMRADSQVAPRPWRRQWRWR
jgi:hypothetical protein